MRRRGEVRPIVWDSWQRSLGSGVDPDGGGPNVDLVDDADKMIVALTLDRCVQVHRSEHFRRRVQPWSRSAAPVHDPMTGQLLGALDVTGGDHVALPQMLPLVRAAAAAAEAEVRWQRLRRPRHGQSAYVRRPSCPYGNTGSAQPLMIKLEVGTLQYSQPSGWIRGNGMIGRF